jgi:hypothetical protein
LDQYDREELELVSLSYVPLIVISNRSTYLGTSSWSVPVIEQPSNQATKRSANNSEYHSLQKLSKK